jgi:Domain of unknown function (DUF4129)
MQRAGSSRSWPVLGAGLVILVGVAVADRWLSGHAWSNTAAMSGADRAVADGIRVGFIALFLFGAACLVMGLTSGGLFGPDGNEGRRRRLGLPWVLSLLAVLALVLMVIWFAIYRTHSPPARIPGLPVSSPASPEHPYRSQNWYRDDWPVILLALAAGAVVTAVWANARRLEARSTARGRRADPTGTDEPDETDEFEIPDGDLDPEAEPDPRRAVVIAYHRMLVLMARRGWARRRSEAPLEHLDRILVGHPGGMDPARSLVSAFERAEYSQHPITSEERDQALAWLRVVVSDLDAVVTTSW